MQAPGFWFRPPERPGLLARLLAPLGRLYGVAGARAGDLSRQPDGRRGGEDAGGHRGAGGAGGARGGGACDLARLWRERGAGGAAPG